MANPQAVAGAPVEVERQHIKIEILTVTPPMGGKRFYRVRFTDRQYLRDTSNAATLTEAVLAVLVYLFRRLSG